MKNMMCATLPVTEEVVESNTNLISYKARDLVKAKHYKFYNEMMMPPVDFSVKQPTPPFKPAKFQCASCDDVIQSSYPGEFVTCKCGEISVDYTEYYGRHIGKPEMFKRISDDNNSSN